MPIIKSAKKALRQNSRKRVFNLRRLRRMRDSVKQTKKLIQAGNKEEALKLLPKTYQAIDKAVKRGVIKKNTANRKKSRLTKVLNKIITQKSAK